MHDFQDEYHCEGVFAIKRGSNPLARLLGWIAGLPASGDQVITKLTVTQTAHGEKWSRMFGKSILESVQSGQPNGQMSEDIGPTRVVFNVRVEDAALKIETASAAIVVGAFQLKLPRWMSPVIVANEQGCEQPGMVRLAVSVALPLLVPLISYDGYIAKSEN
jgi:hypothetical protein